MSSDKRQLVTFRLGDDQFAADIFSVERVLRYVKPRPVPDLPAWMEGVLDYRGRVVPVIDLRARFGAEGTRPEGARIVVCEAGDGWIAMTVDSVQEVATIDNAQIEPPPTLFRGLTKEYLTGMVRRDGAVLVVLNVSHLLTSQEQLQLERAVRAGVGQ
ncbi:MAG: chemotaxis protein CheW [Gemmatimonadota bacterium]|nr:chemotaxis protein CheW [Gemmatimonadota bacterium]